MAVLGLGAGPRIALGKSPLLILAAIGLGPRRLCLVLRHAGATFGWLISLSVLGAAPWTGVEVVNMNLVLGEFRRSAAGGGRICRGQQRDRQRRRHAWAAWPRERLPSCSAIGIGNPFQAGESSTSTTCSSWPGAASSPRVVAFFPLLHEPSAALGSLCLEVYGATLTEPARGYWGCRRRSPLDKRAKYRRRSHPMHCPCTAA